MFRVTKTYGHELGLSACFRQWKASSHCQYIHGYALAFTVVFEVPDEERNECGWVIDFGGLKPLKQYLTETFDHRFLVAKDDPALSLFKDMDEEKQFAVRTKPKLVQLMIVDGVGCENFAEMVASYIEGSLRIGSFGVTKARLVSVECREHAGNSATYFPGV